MAPSAGFQISSSVGVGSAVRQAVTPGQRPWLGLRVSREGGKGVTRDGTHGAFTNGCSEKLGEAKPPGFK